MTLPGTLQPSRFPPVRALLLCAILLAAGSAGAAEESPPSQNPDYLAGLEAIQSSDWRRAIDSLNVAQVAEPTNADLQYWLGYAYRREGKYNAALDNFRAALDLNPGHRGAHENMGETYLLIGNKAKAREHLAALLRICGTKCDEYRDLQRAIAAAK